MADWTWIQGTQGTAGGQSSYNQSFGAPVGIGNYAIGGFLLDTGITITSILDNKSNSYSIVASHDDGTLFVGVFLGGPFTNGPQTITITPSAPGTDQWLEIDEFAPPTGSTGAALVDGSVTWSNATSSPLGSFSTTRADALCYAALQDTGSSTPGAGWTAGGSTAGHRATQYMIQSTPGSVSVLATVGDNWGAAFGLSYPAASPGLPNASYHSPIFRVRKSSSWR